MHISIEQSIARGTLLARVPKSLTAGQQDLPPFAVDVYRYWEHAWARKVTKNKYKVQGDKREVPLSSNMSISEGQHPNYEY